MDKIDFEKYADNIPKLVINMFIYTLKVWIKLISKNTQITFPS